MINNRKLVDAAPVVILIFGLTLVALYLRSSVATFVPIAESLTFGFQLMLAGTVLAILRNEAGLTTFGVFGPVILAFAWIEAGPFWGFLFIAYVFLVAVTVRYAISGLDLGTAHRVATLLVVASIAIFVIQAVGQLQAVPQFTTVLLFPVILTAWYGERFVGSLVDTGWAPASRRLLFTVVGIGAAYAVASYEPLVSFVVHTPESWVGLVALNIVLGAGTDTRLSEYLRFRELRRALGAENSGDILSIRARNRDYITRYNPAPLMRIFDKARMKRLLHGLDIPTPETYRIVDEAGVQSLAELFDKRSTFVIKPVDGMGGRDALVVRGRDPESGQFLTNRGPMSEADVLSHARNICVGGLADYGARNSAMVESLVQPEGLLADRVNGGVPDLRIITLHGHPVMAMARLPTEESKGTANIHGGAVAVAVGIATGEASGGYQQTRDRFLDEHPDTGASLNFQIPDWEDVLVTASRAATASGLGYTGVDIVFDEDRGPMVLEVNRRPGLGIQNANMDGLLRRLRYVESYGTATQYASSRDRVRNAIEWAENGWVSGDTSVPDRPKTVAEVAR